MSKIFVDIVTAVTLMTANPSQDSITTKIQYYYYSAAEEQSLIEECKVKKTKYVPIKLVLQADTITVTQIADNEKPVKKVKDEIRYLGTGVWDYYEMTDKAIFIHFKKFTRSTK